MKARVLGDEQYSNLIRSWEFDIVDHDNVTDIDLLVFCGGTDVNPQLYGENLIPGTSKPDVNRDVFETRLYKKALKNGVPVFGICRGSQFLTVMQEGGKLIQHIENHTTSHDVWCFKTHEKFEVTSTHHQMMDPRNISGKYNVFATSYRNRSEVYLTGGGINFKMPLEYEAVHYPETNCLAIQWHPEWMEEGSRGKEVVKEWVQKLVNFKL